MLILRKHSMEQRIRLLFGAIAILTLTLGGCDDDDPEIVTEQGERRVFFSAQNVEVGRDSPRPFEVDLVYQGPATNETIEVSYTVSLPNENGAVEGEDFILPKSNSFIIEKGKDVTRVVLLQRLLDNQDAQQSRTLSFELQAQEGVVIGNSLGGGNSITVTIGPAIDPIDPEDFIGDKKFSFVSEGITYKIPYFSNSGDINDINDTNITTAVIAVHGSGLNANGQFEAISVAAQMETINLDTLLLVAPQYPSMDEIDQFLLDEEHLYWSSSWRIGSASQDEEEHPREERFSSFEVMDSLITRLSEYPNMKKIVLTGHSAGGQFTSRYVMSSPIVEVLATKNIAIDFVVNNPGTYTYMDDRRRVLGTENTFEVPASFITEDCPDYNEYGFGLEDLFSYLEDVGGADVIRERLGQREVTYLIGQNDNDPTPEETSINEQCEAILQGRDRFERATNYFDHLIDFYGPSILERQELFIVPGVGHSSSGIYQSEIGRRSIFGN